ncbi:dethiobiotin synthase [Paracoccus aminophilus]|uniref:ATP-dependent dethiobiotin synthetase BioD n=1 Tax=Paracoccus aminophilus JCM 7686 TaxID=1367847 RepID=S5XXC3_PARAH|nr:dethiobiotin synthase [Paracoccus aminophilus]AGT08080.1 dethiobiotin synthase [Paracoccus aminophilus JCM 7686]
MSALIVTGTDTGIGKSVFSAGLTRALGASYWKPVQSGLEEETDSEVVARLAPGCAILPEAYRLHLPASPHRAAAAEGITLDPVRLGIPAHDGPLLIEGAGGLMVPLTPDLLTIDQFAAWQAPVILCARTGLGTINHSLLSLEALRARAIAVIGVVFIGPPEPDSEAIITRLGGTRHLGRLPVLPDLGPDALAEAFTAIDLASIRAALA